MRIAFDVRPFLKEETGVGIYFRNLLFSLSRIDRENHYYLFSSSWKDRFPGCKIPPLNNLVFNDLRFPVRLINFLWHKTGWPPLEYFFRADLDLTHSPTPLILPTRGKKIVTVYDLFFMDNPDLSDAEARRHFLPKIEESLQRADAVITISQFTKDQLLRRFPLDAAKAHVVHLGIDHSTWMDVPAGDLDAVRMRHGLPSDFLLFVGAFEPRKNLLRLLEAMKSVQQRYGRIALVLAGRPGQDHPLLMQKIQELGLAPEVRLLGYLGERELRCLYRLASVFVFPSLCEGFGLPLLEAMASRLPVAASRASALPEILEDAALYFDPLEPEGMAGQIVRILQDEDVRADLVDKGVKRVRKFSWDKTARQTLSLYEKTAGQG